MASEFELKVGDIIFYKNEPYFGTGVITIVESNFVLNWRFYNSVNKKFTYTDSSPLLRDGTFLPDRKDNIFNLNYIIYLGQMDEKQILVAAMKHGIYYEKF